MTIPRLELIENPNNKNDFIIFRHQIRSKKVPTFSKKRKLPSKKTRKHKKHITRKHKKYKSLFNIF
jgi:hypothetical protein